jgi:nicotinate phosphoribosyltransferase
MATTLDLDRYHATMGDAALKEAARLGDALLGETGATFYVTQRKLPYAPCVGHERLLRSLPAEAPDEARLRFLERDRGGLRLFAEKLGGTRTFAGAVRAVRPGTIVFAGEPFADVTGPFALTQAQEIKFEHAFDLAMTTAALAMRFRAAAGDRWLSDFSLRRGGDAERAADVAAYSFVGGFNDTSNLEAAYRFGIPAVGTAAHYWQQSFVRYMDEPEIDPRSGRPKHFEQVAFERWLDANPQGTILLLDTIDVRRGAAHAALAATSAEARRRAFKGFRLDSGDLAELGAWCLSFFETHGLNDLMAILTGDLTAERVAEIVGKFPAAAGFGVGTKLSAEVERVAGVIFKQCVVGGRPTMKVSDEPAKSTLPGRVQLFRGADSEGFYVADLVGLDDEEAEIPGAASVERLLLPFRERDRHEAVASIHEQKAFVEQQRARFRDIDNYPHGLSPRLRELRDALAARMRGDDTGRRQAPTTPDAAPDHGE